MTSANNICFPLTLSEQIFGIGEIREQSRYDFQAAERQPKPAVVVVLPTRVNLDEPTWNAAFDAIGSEQRLSA